MAGLTAGALAVCAVVIQVVCLVLMKKGNELFAVDDTSLDKGLCFLVALAAVGGLGLGVKAKTSLFFSVLPLLLTAQNNNPDKIFVLGVVL